jgi:hypothetical protein
MLARLYGVKLQAENVAAAFRPLFGVSTYGPEKLLRLTEGLGLVVTT